MPGSSPAGLRRRSLSLLEAYRYLHLRTPEFIGWEIATLFCAMMHRVQECIIRSGDVPPTNHRERSVCVGLKMPTMQEAYETLRAMGHRSRYRPEYATTAAGERKAWAMREEIAASLP